MLRRVHFYRDEKFLVTGVSPYMAEVDLVCPDHEHAEFEVCLIDGVDENWVTTSSSQSTSDWAVGRESNLYPIDGKFRDAVERASDLLLEECYSMAQIEEFFGDDGDGPTAAKIQSYWGNNYAVTRDSPVSATVNKICREHNHLSYMLGLLDDEAAGWIMGRTEANTPKYSCNSASFAEAVQQAANLLHRECLSMAQLDGFFREGVVIMDDKALPG